MEKPNILEIKTLKKFSVTKQFVVEVSVDVYAQSKIEAEQIADKYLHPIEYTDSVGFDYKCDDLDAHGYFQLMKNLEVYGVWNNSLVEATIDDYADVCNLYQCEEDEDSDDTDTLFISEEYAIQHWEDYHKPKKNDYDED